MIPVRPAGLIACLFLPAACDGSRPADTGRADGEFTLRRTQPNPASLVRTPASASWCEADSTLLVLGVSGDGAGGLAARVLWPATEPDTLGVGRELGLPGTATLAWRPMDDSVRTAFVADSGRVVLRGDGVVSGTVTAAGRDRDTVLVRVSGTIENVPVVRGCPGPAP